MKRFPTPNTSGQNFQDPPKPNLVLHEQLFELGNSLSALFFHWFSRYIWNNKFMWQSFTFELCLSNVSIVLSLRLQQFKCWNVPVSSFVFFVDFLMNFFPTEIPIFVLTIFLTEHFYDFTRLFIIQAKKWIKTARVWMIIKSLKRYFSCSTELGWKFI